MKWQSQKQEINALKENQKNDNHLKWWKTIDMNDKYLCKLWSSMFGSTEQRIQQLYIIRNNLNLKKL